MEHHQIIAKQEAELRKGPWLEEEDEALIAAVSVMGERRWDALAKASGNSASIVRYIAHVDKTTQYIHCKFCI